MATVTVKKSKTISAITKQFSAFLWIYLQDSKRSREPVVQVELMLNDTGNKLKTKERLQPIPQFRPTALAIKRSSRIDLLTRRP